MSRARVGWLALACATVFSISATSANAAPLFPNLTLTADLQPAALTHGDFNGDGNQDLVSANTSAGNVSVFLGDGDGDFSPAASFPANDTPMSIASGDIDGDGKLDLVTAQYNSDAVAVLPGEGDGTFGPQVDFAVGTSPTAVAVADLDHDGLSDAVTANAGDGHVSVLLNDGAGGFDAAVPYDLGADPDAVAIGDLDGDGNEDIVAASPVEETVSVLLGDGSGGFSPATQSPAGPSPAAVAVARLDADATPDLVVTNDDPANTVSVLIGNGDGSYAVAASYPTGMSPQAVAIADFDGDGNADVASANCCDNDVSILFGDGQGGLAPQVTYPTGPGPVAVIAFDVDGNGHLDLATANGDGVTVTTLMNRGDGTFTAPASYAAGPGPSAFAMADFNGDGVPDLATANSGAGADEPDDLSVFIGNGDGTFQPQQPYDLDNGTRAVAAGDLDADGDKDLVTIDVDGTLSILLGNGDGTFGPPASLTAGDFPGSLVIVDVNGDGKLDLALADNGNDGVDVLLGNGDGTFRSPSSMPVGEFPATIVTNDFNADGKPDLLTANGGAGNDFSLLLGNGDGTFAPAQSIPTGNALDLVISGDVNGDGRPDLIGASTSGCGCGDISVLLAEPTGGFAAPVQYGGDSLPVSLALGDVNADGIVDLIAGAISLGFFGSQADVRLGDGTGAFAAPQAYQTGIDPGAIGLGDLDLDGSLDIAAAACCEDVVNVLLNQSPHGVIGTGAAVISELRLGGPQGAGDQYVEIFNRSTDTALDLGGWWLEGSNAQREQIAYGTMVPPNGRLMLAGPPNAATGASLLNTLGARTMQLPFGNGGNLAIPETDGGVRLTSPSRVTVDAVGFGGVDPAFREGTALTVPSFEGQPTFLRRFDAGNPVDTDDNATDFVALDTEADGTAATVLGAPRPDGLTAPTVHNDILQATPVDPSAAANATPNRIYTPGTGGDPGTLIINRTLINCSGTTAGPCANARPDALAQTVTRLRFRITGLTTVGSPGSPSQAILVAKDSQSNDYPLSAGGTVHVDGLTMDAPTPASGGGLNTTFTATALLPAGGLDPGDSVNVSFAFEIRRTGSFSFAFNTEDDLVTAAPGAPTPPASNGAGTSPAPATTVAGVVSESQAQVADDTTARRPRPAQSPAAAAPTAGTPTAQPPARRRAGRVAARFHRTRHRTSLTRLHLSHVAPNAKLKVTCRGTGCGAHHVMLRVRSGAVALPRRLRTARLAAGTRLTIALGAPGTRTVTKRYVMRHAARPKRV